MNEIEFLAACVHAPLSAMHVGGAVHGRLPRKVAGAAAALHCLAILYNLRRANIADVAAHLCGALVAQSDKRLLHISMAIYDGGAAFDHARAAHL